MIIIKPQSPIFERVIGRCKVKSGADYQLSAFCLKQDTDLGMLLYNTLTDEIIIADEKEDREELIARRYLVPTCTDELKTVEQCRRLEQLLTRPEVSKGIQNAVILTTTGCNARCYYCFERGCEVLTMDNKTALATADYVVRHKNPDAEFNICWFGGEPLLNTAAMDTISLELKQRSIPFCSSIITNGYLFNEANIRKAIEIWNLKSAQITLDGTAETYNRTKAYVYADDPNPFETVLKNIELLTGSGIPVSIRINLSSANGEDLEKLIDLLAARFHGNDPVRMYVKVIYQQTGMEALWQKHKQLSKKIRSFFPYQTVKQVETVKFFGCEADSETGLTVMPDGSLLCCQHFVERPQAWGSVFSEEINDAVKRWWKEAKPWEEACRTCFYAPKCYKPVHCPEAKDCYQIRRDEIREELTAYMLEAYAEWKRQEACEL